MPLDERVLEDLGEGQLAVVDRVERSPLLVSCLAVPGTVSQLETFSPPLI